MEVGRMMPGRFNKLYQKLPLFLAFAIPMFAGWSILNETYALNREENYHQMVITTFFTIIVVIMYVLFAFFVEGLMLHVPKYVHKYFPPAKLDSYDVYGPVPSETNVRNLEAWMAASKIEDEFASFNVVMGRPTGPMVLESARTAEAPGIFMCGPRQMIAMVKKETNKENSWLGKTRYCLYNEEFDM
jgi:hypothetical protein